MSPPNLELNGILVLISLNYVSLSDSVKGETEHVLYPYVIATLLTTQNVFPVFRPPVITGETTLNEGDTLDLDCDVSTSSPLPSVQWFSPQGDLISNSSHLEIMNIQRDKVGIYTCIATQLDSGAMLNSTVNIIPCECMYYRH